MKQLAKMTIHKKSTKNNLEKKDTIKTAFKKAKLNFFNVKK